MYGTCLAWGEGLEIEEDAMPYRLREDGSFAYGEAERKEFARERAAAAGVDWDATYEREEDARAAAARINRARVPGLQLRIEVEHV